MALKKFIALGQPEGSVRAIKVEVCTLVRSAYCTSIIAPRRRRDASDNIEWMAIAMSGCLPSGQVCRGRKLFAFERASAFGDPIVAAKLLISLGHFDHSRGPQVARARAILLVSCKISAFPFPKFLDAGGDSPGDIFGGLFLLRRSKNSLSRTSGRHEGQRLQMP